MKISVIIPFYNVENYIIDCINSVKAQTFSDFECILVDDKSEDNSLKNAIEAISNDIRFRIISHKKNMRQGGARNTGIKNANGDWIAFLDSDDEWKSNFLEEMYNEAIASGADIVVCDYENIDKEGRIINYSSQYISGIQTNKDLLLESFLETPSPVNKLYKKEIWKEICFPTNIFYEDLATIFKTIFFAKKVSFINNSLYIYKQREDSTTKQFNEKQITDRLSAFAIIEDFFKKNKIKNDPILIRIYASRIVRSACFNILKYNTHNTNRSKIKILKDFRYLLDRKYFGFKYIRYYNSFSLKMFSLLFNSSITLTYLIGMLWIKINKKKI